MTQPSRYLIRIVIFLALTVAVIAALASEFKDAFVSNPALNGLIVGVLVLGIVYILRQVLMLRPAVRWVETLQRNEPGLSVSTPPNLVAPLANMLQEQRGRRTLSALSFRSLLDSMSARLDESREISRYMIGLLIFLGLLGTFWGLLNTIDSIGDTIRSLNVASGDYNEVFEDLKAGLERPLGGMATAFSSSIFGLAGSLVLGFLEIQSTQAQNRFYNDLEEWLSGMTRLSGGGAVGDGDQSVPAYIQALLEQTADSLESLQRVIARGEEDRQTSAAGINALNDKIATLADSMKVEQDLMLKLAESQQMLHPVLSKLSDGPKVGGGMDDASRTHLRNIDSHMNRLLEDQAKGRRESIQEVRNEIRLLARTIAAIAEGEG